MLSKTSRQHLRRKHDAVDVAIPPTLLTYVVRLVTFIVGPDTAQVSPAHLKRVQPKDDTNDFESLQDRPQW
jgi:hypothetical protein